jgi:acyl carrier protein
MTNATTEQELIQIVEKAVHTVLNLPSDQILLTSTLVGDLGAESIDFLDLSCELEKFTDVEIDFRKLFQAKRLKPDGGGVDVSIGELVEHLKSRLS